MSKYASNAKLSDLRLADEPVPAVRVSAAVETVTPSPDVPAVHDTESPNADEFLVAATREFEGGKIDPPLWARALDLAGKDAALAKPGYLRARAATLRAANRGKRAELPAKHARASAQERKETRVARAHARPRSTRHILITGAFGFILVVGGFLVLRPASDPPKSADISRPAGPGTKSGRSMLPEGATSMPVKASGLERRAVSSEEFVAKVAELKAAENWNVVVLYAVEWTRKIPDDADAWNELSGGYIRLHQYNDALDAATKAGQLAPKNARAWQNLGEINVALRQPAAALPAFEKAVALNERDLASLVQIGMLNAQLGQLPQAKIAFAKALDIYPMDADSLCGTASIAQKEGRTKEADSIARQLKAADLRCPDAAAAVPVPVPAAPAAKKRPVSPATR